MILCGLYPDDDNGLILIILCISVLLVVGALKPFEGTNHLQLPFFVRNATGTGRAGTAGRLRLAGGVNSERTYLDLMGIFIGKVRIEWELGIYHIKIHIYIIYMYIYM